MKYIGFLGLLVAEVKKKRKKKRKTKVDVRMCPPPPYPPAGFLEVEKIKSFLAIRLVLKVENQQDCLKQFLFLKIPRRHINIIYAIGLTI